MEKKEQRFYSVHITTILLWLEPTSINLIVYLVDNEW